MEVKRKFFDISFIALLSDVTKILEFSEPIYNQLQESNNMTYVVVRTTIGSQAYYFEGGQCEDAAEKAVRCLAKKYRLRIKDINLQKKERHDNSSKFYKALRANLGDVDIDQSSRQVRHQKTRSFTGYLKSVSINYKDLLADILKEFGISVTDVDNRNFKTGGYVCCFCIKNPKEEWAMEWIMGERCDTLDAANQSLAKKAILYLKPLYNFEIKDVSFSEMFFGDAICALDRESYIDAKEKLLLTRNNISTPPITSRHECTNPEGSEFQIHVLSSPTPPPKKRRAYQKGSSSTMLASAISNEDDFDLAYKIHDPK